MTLNSGYCSSALLNCGPLFIHLKNSVLYACFTTVGTRLFAKFHHSTSPSLSRLSFHQSLSQVGTNPAASFPSTVSSSRAGRSPGSMQSSLPVGRHFKWSGDCTVAANKNLPIKAVTHTACGKKRHAFFLHRTGKAV